MSPPKTIGRLSQRAAALSSDGKVVLLGQARWDEARRAWNPAVDQRPTAVVLPESAADVAAATRLAVELDLRVAPQATGHRAVPLGPLDGTILLRTGRMRAVEVDAAARTARIQAGAAVGPAATAEQADAAATSLEALRQALAPWTAPLMCLNFADTSRDPRTLWNQQAYERLRREGGGRPHRPDSRQPSGPPWPGGG